SGLRRVERVQLEYALAARIRPRGHRDADAVGDRQVAALEPQPHGDRAGPAERDVDDAEILLLAIVPDREAEPVCAVAAVDRARDRPADHDVHARLLRATGYALASGDGPVH